MSLPYSKQTCYSLVSSMISYVLKIVLLTLEKHGEQNFTLHWRHEQSACDLLHSRQSTASKINKI